MCSRCRRKGWVQALPLFPRVPEKSQPVWFNRHAGVMVRTETESFVQQVLGEDECRKLVTEFGTPALERRIA